MRGGAAYQQAESTGNPLSKFLPTPLVPCGVRLRNELYSGMRACWISPPLAEILATPLVEKDFRQIEWSKEVSKE